MQQPASQAGEPTAPTRPTTSPEATPSGPWPRIKRFLRPVRPILLPISARLRTFTEVMPERDAPSWRWGRALARRIRPIRPIRRAEWNVFAAQTPYAKGRWAYTSVAGAIADELIRRDHLRSALELGPYLRPLIVGADVMDLAHHADLQAEGAVIIHDATVTPWPIADRRYDLFVALQVFEHLGDRQNAAFAEVRRIARHAIISLPIDWVMDDPTNSHHMISHERALSWFAPIAPTRVELGNPGPKKRLIYVFENLDRG
jgi:hypothetical protein